MSDDLVPNIDILEAQPGFEESGLNSIPYVLRLMPGECVVIACRNSRLAEGFSDLCSGLVPLVAGKVSCMGLDWRELSERRAWALRGRIGRALSSSAWVDVFDTDRSILLQQLHHTRTPEEVLVKEAVDMCHRFGLPGLPTLPARALNEPDRVKASLVRAFLGEPQLLLLEDPLTTESLPLQVPLLNEILAVSKRGGSTICFVRHTSHVAYYAPLSPRRFRLLDDGLFPVRQSV